MAKSADSMCSPSTSHFSSCIGAVELLIRGIGIVATILVIVSASQTLVDLDIPIPTPNDDLPGDPNLDTFITNLASAISNLPQNTAIENLISRGLDAHNSTRGMAIWMLIVSSVVIVLEVLLLMAHFCNFGVSKIFSAVDVIISIVIAVCFFCGAVPAAVYSKEWEGIKTEAEAILSVIVFPTHYVLGPLVSLFNLDRLVTSTGATAAFGLISVILFSVLAVWIVVSVCFKSSNGGSGKKNKKNGGGVEGNEKKADESYPA